MVEAGGVELPETLTNRLFLRGYFESLIIISLILSKFLSKIANIINLSTLMSDSLKSYPTTHEIDFEKAG